MFNAGCVMSTSNTTGSSATLPPVKADPVPPLPEGAETIAFFKTADGVEQRGTPLRFTHQSIVFELYNPGTPPPLSTVLAPFQIAVQRRVLYAGRAVIHKVVESGTRFICEAELDETSWQDVDVNALLQGNNEVTAEFRRFTGGWQKFYKLSADFKSVVTDIQGFLHDLRVWLDQIEVGLRQLPDREHDAAERELGKKLLPLIAPAVDSLFERFEIACNKLPPDAYSEHRTFCHRQLHPLLMTCPFMHRIFAKPLGYAGDYEMIDMIIRNRLEGGSLFAKMLQAYILDQGPARSVRNRAEYFTRKFVEETARVRSRGGIASFFSLGCGPAREVEVFLTNHELADHAQVKLLDFSAETLKQTSTKLQRVREKYHRRTPIITVNNSVNGVLKEIARAQRPEPEYDFIYCSGLYDYLNDRVCVQLNTYLYDQLKPGGTLIVTNFDPCNPIRNVMEYIFEWFLIHRDAPHLATLKPEQAAEGDCRVVADATGCNVFLEAYKPE